MKASVSDAGGGEGCCGDVDTGDRVEESETEAGEAVVVTGVALMPGWTSQVEAVVEVVVTFRTNEAPQ